MKVKVSYTVDLEEIPNVVRHMVNSTHDMQDEIAELTSQLSRGDLGVKSLKNLDRLNLDKKSFVFHAGTKIIKDRLVSNGGRVLNITSTGNNFYKIRKKIINLISMINWKYGFFRKDIGWKIINKK